MSFGWTDRVSARHRAIMSFALTMLATIIWGAPLSAAAIERVEVTAERITLTFDDVVADASAFLLDGPRRLAIDVGGATPGDGGGGAGPVAAIRQGQYDPATARVVFDLERPVTFANGRFSEDGRAFRIDIEPASQPDFAAAADRGRRRFLPPLAFRARPPRARGEVTVPLPAARPYRPAALPRVQGPEGRPLVVIDAGHGGHDPGAISPFGERREEDATLAIARALRDILVNSGRVRVALTREDDRYLVHRERFGIARRLGAELFISVHIDSAPNPEARGATVYTLSEVASDAEAAQLARRENASDIINGVNLGGETEDVRSILIDLTQRETMNVSARFANLIRRVGEDFIAFKPDHHRFASLLVLKAPDVPSVLFEAGYLTNRDDTEIVFSRAGQRRIAQGLAQSIETHFARRIAGTR